MSGITNKLVGGKQSAINSSNFSQISPEETKRLQDIESQINSLFEGQSAERMQSLAQSADIQGLFANNLKSFLTNGTNPTPEQIAQAEQFVDQTFTNPAQEVLRQRNADYASQAQAQAAALGRNPNADIATQQAIAGEGMRQGIGLSAERGQRIAQNVNDQFGRGLQGLQTGMQGSNFLNGLTQQAFGNQLSLLNGRTGLAGIYQNERGQRPVGIQTSSGVLSNINSVMNAGSNVIAGGSNQVEMIGGLFGKAGSLGGLV